jgi:hypothetical protein
VRASTRSTSRSPDRIEQVSIDPALLRRRVLHRHRAKLGGVVLFYEIVLVLAVLVITWFALYALYRLITDES